MRFFQLLINGNQIMATLNHLFFSFLCIFLPYSLFGKIEVTKVKSSTILPDNSRLHRQNTQPDGIDTNGTQLNSVLPEINSLRINNTQIRNWYEIQDRFFRTLCTYTEAIKIAHQKNDLLSHIFFSVYPSLPLLAGEKGTLLYLPPQETPVLNTLLDGLCQKLSIPRPEVYLLDTQPCYNFYTTSFTPNSAILILSRTLLEMLTEQELTVALAHELTHIQSYDALKKQIISTTQMILVITVLAWFFIKEKEDLSTKHIKFLSIIGGLIAATSIADSLINEHNESNANEKAIEITQEPTAFLSMIHKIEHYQMKQHLNDYNRFNHYIKDFSKNFPLYGLMIKTAAFFYHQVQSFCLQTAPGMSCTLHNPTDSEEADILTANTESKTLSNDTSQSLAT